MNREKFQQLVLDICKEHAEKGEDIQTLGSVCADLVINIGKLPSVQTECSFEIQDILDYLNTTLHPIISPEYWNVYSELYDMISALSSAERRGRWEPYLNEGLIVKCSVCDSRYVARWNYCPNCGAKMDGEKV